MRLCVWSLSDERGWTRRSRGALGAFERVEGRDERQRPDVCGPVHIDRTSRYTDARSTRTRTHETLSCSKSLPATPAWLAPSTQAPLNAPPRRGRPRTRPAPPSAAPPAPPGTCSVTNERHKKERVSGRGATGGGEAAHRRRQRGRTHSTLRSRVASRATSRASRSRADASAISARQEGGVSGRTRGSVSGGERGEGVARGREGRTEVGEERGEVRDGLLDVVDVLAVPPVVRDAHRGHIGDGHLPRGRGRGRHRAVGSSALCWREFQIRERRRGGEGLDSLPERDRGCVIERAEVWGGGGNHLVFLGAVRLRIEGRHVHTASHRQAREPLGERCQLPERATRT